MGLCVPCPHGGVKGRCEPPLRSGSRFACGDPLTPPPGMAEVNGGSDAAASLPWWKARARPGRSGAAGEVGAQPASGEQRHGNERFGAVESVGAPREDP
jgi:hypothetical protein